ncbi:MAG: hypothetical protein V4572_05880 [Bacteroidota bacterium]
MLPSFGNMIVYTKFKINQDEIAQTICIQKKIVNNSCNGRCELLKSLKKFEDNERKMSNHLKEKTELVYISTILETPSSIVIPAISTQKNYSSFDKKPISVVLSNFRPPAYFI